MISKRLELVASFVPQGAVLLDVGSDHAYLPIELVAVSYTHLDVYKRQGPLCQSPLEKSGYA